MRAILGLPGGLVGAPVSPAELADALGRGSYACALDDLLRDILRLTRGHGIGSLAALLGGVGLHGSLLGAVLHIALIKKQPSWLMRNSRLVLLQPSLRRAEAGVQFRRLMQTAEV